MPSIHDASMLTPFALIDSRIDSPGPTSMVMPERWHRTWKLSRAASDGVCASGLAANRSMCSASFGQDWQNCSTALSKPSGPQQYTRVSSRGLPRTLARSGIPCSFRGQIVTRSPYFESSSTKAIDDRCRPPYIRCQSAPSASAASIIGSIGVMPVPPAMNWYRFALWKGKWLRGPRTWILAPLCSS